MRSEPFGVARAACFEQLAGVFASCGAPHYAKIFASLKIKNDISLTPLNCALNAFTFALKDSAEALVDLVWSFSVPDGKRCRVRINELIFHLLHFSNETVTGAMKSRGTCSTFPAKPLQVSSYCVRVCSLLSYSTERSEWRYV